MLKIHAYSSAADFLRDSWLEKKKKNPSFSIRSWSRSLGFKNNAPLSLMLQKKRPIPKRYVPLFAKSLDLSEKEKQYLALLIDYNREKTVEGKKYFFVQMQNLFRTKFKTSYEIATFEFLENPLAMAILEMIELKHFQYSAKWIQKKLHNKYSIQEIRQNISVLKRLKLLSENEKGLICKTHKNIVSTQDIRSEAIQSYHKNICQMAKWAVEHQPVEQREFNSYSFNISQDKIKKAKTLIRNFIDDFLVQIEAEPGEGDETYQINVQLFSHTQCGKNGGDEK